MAADTGVPVEEPIVLPSRSDPVVRALSTAFGGPIGRRARLGAARWWTPVRLLVLFAVLGSTLGWMQKSSCATHGYTHEYQYSRLCYTDVLALWYDEKLDAGRVPTVEAVDPSAPDPSNVSDHKYVEYPVVIGGLMAAAQGLTLHLVSDQPTGSERRAIDTFAQDQKLGLDRSSVQADRDRYAIDQYRAANATAAYETRRARWFFDFTALFMVVFAVVVVVCTGLTAGRRRVWDAAMVGLCPVLVLHADVNWDLAAVAFTAAALLSWSRRAPKLAGMFLGLGAATKLFPVLLLVPLLALCIRAGLVRVWLKTAAVAVAAWLVVDVPFMIVNWNGWWYFYGFSSRRGTEYNSLFYAWQYFVRGANDPMSYHAMDLVELVVVLLLLAGIFLVCLVARRRPRLAQVAFLSVLAFVLSNKVYSPQYALWLLPLVVLARPRWRAFLVWQLSEVLLLVTLYAHLIYVDKGGAKGIGYAWFFALGNGPRDLVLLVLAGLVLREIARPELDVVRADGADDPGGGLLDHAPDVFAPSPAPVAAAAGSPWAAERAPG